MDVETPNHIVRLLELAQRRIDRDLADIAWRSRPGPMLTHAQSRLLQMIPAQGITATQLSGFAHITKQGLGQMVDILEERGMVRRRPDPADGRSRIITRTQQGERAIEEINAWMSELHRQLREVLGAETYQVFRDALTTLGQDEVDPYSGSGPGEANIQSVRDNT